jgi:archaemetzincin
MWGKFPTCQFLKAQVGNLRHSSALVAFFRMAFTPPDENAIRDAIGDLSRLPPLMQRAFAPDRNSFDPIPKPGTSDWLAVQHEPGQTFDEFKASRPNHPTQDRHVIYLQPLGDFAPKRSPPLDKLRDFAEAFFAMEVKSLPAVPIDTAKFTRRENPLTHNRQVLTGDVLNFLRTRFPSDAFCIIAVTMEDLYPEKSWNFVFGQASLRERVGVYSFARYDPAFYCEPRAADYATLLLRRSCKVLAHETGHMFGLAHCTFFNCLMNGSNHLGESDRRPLHLCPACLRKLQSSTGFDALDRYRAIGFIDEADWLHRRIATLQTQ